MNLAGLRPGSYHSGYVDVETCMEGTMVRVDPLWMLAGWIALVAINIGLAIAVSFSGAL